MDILHWDIETAADVDIRKVGLDVYSSPRSRPRVLMAAWRLNDHPIRQWECRDGPIPCELREALLDPHVQKWAFNAQFERVMCRRVLGIPTPVTNWRCGMVLAYMQSFSGGLDDVGAQIGLPDSLRKGKEGLKLIKMFSMPQRLTKANPHLWRNWITDPVEWDQFCEYNRQDVVTEESAVKRLSPFPVPDDEWQFYELDQEINDRGMPLDFDFITNVMWMAEQRQGELVGELRQITGLDNPNSVAQFLPWVQRRGYPYDDLQKESVEKAIKRFDSGELRSIDNCVDALRIRQWSARTSIGKAETAGRVVGDDGRARYLFQFAGASRTNRFSGREIQPQNMFRTPKELDAEEGDEKLTVVTDLIRCGDYDGFDLVFDEPMQAFVGCMRGMFRAPDGYVLQAVDFSSIESAGLAWVTGCERLLEVFRSGRDPYKDFGTLFYGKPYEEITRAERQICKPPTLGCGYRLSAGRDVDGVKTGLLRYAENMGVEMTLAEAVRAVRVFRTGYPEVQVFWYDCEKAIKFVIENKQPFMLGPIRFEWLRPYLLIRLPSGRCIYYYKPQLQRRDFYTGRTIRRRVDGRVVEEDEVISRQTLTYMGRNQRNHQWTRLDSHGGVITENIVQALTRDMLAVGLTRLAAAGFQIIGHSHDEALALTRRGDNRLTLSRMLEIFKQPIEWAPGFPLNAAGWEGQFYRK